METTDTVGKGGVFDDIDDKEQTNHNKEQRNHNKDQTNHNKDDAAEKKDTTEKKVHFADAQWMDKSEEEETVPLKKILLFLRWKWVKMGA